MEDCAGLRDWELVVASALSETLKAADALDDDSEDGAIKADYFALDSSGRRDRPQSEEESIGRSEDYDNPNWIDPDSNTRFLETSRGQLGFIGTKIPERNSCDFWSDDSSDGQKSLPGGEKVQSLNLGDSFMEVASEESDASCENLGGESENYGTQEMVDVGGYGNDYAREGGKRDNAWRKMPLELLKFCIFMVRPVWSIPIAVAMVGIVMLGRKLYRLKHKSWSIPLRISINDKVNLTGGYYDAGDNVKFGFPMAFTTTMLSWSVIEFGKRMGSDNIRAARVAVRWSTDYLLKAAAGLPDRLYVGVGDPNSDHNCWERPEDMDTPRTVYSVSPSAPGSDVAGETAAALAAASLVFRSADKGYSSRLLSAAKKVMAFAVKYLGKYSDSLGGAVCPFYCSYSGYKDELLWGASWLLKATNDVSYLNYLNSLGANDQVDIFSWDNKFAGAKVLLARKSLIDKNKAYDAFRVQAEEFVCRILPNSSSSSTQYTPGGLMFKLSSSNLQYVTSISFLLTTYAKFMASSSHTFYCGNLFVTSKIIRNLAQKQVDYILGDNPLKMSYMVGYGAVFPKKIHHRGSSLPSKAKHANSIGCQEGFQYLNSPNPNPNILTGAVVGGPNQNDAFPDDRNDYAGSEPATYINAPLVGCLAYLVGRQGTA